MTQQTKGSRRKALGEARAAGRQLGRMARSAATGETDRLSDRERILFMRQISLLQLLEHCALERARGGSAPETRPLDAGTRRRWRRQMNSVSKWWREQCDEVRTRDGGSLAIQHLIALEMLRGYLSDRLAGGE